MTTDARRSTYRKIVRLVQESQRAYADAKVAEVEGTVGQYQRASAHYHEVDALVERNLREVLALTETDLDPLHATREAVRRASERRATAEEVGGY